MCVQLEMTIHLKCIASVCHGFQIEVEEMIEAVGHAKHGNIFCAIDAVEILVFRTFALNFRP